MAPKEVNTPMQLWQAKNIAMVTELHLRKISVGSELSTETCWPLTCCPLSLLLSVLYRDCPSEKITPKSTGTLIKT